jgi:hypothetical protein
MRLSVTQHMHGKTTTNWLGLPPRSIRLTHQQPNRVTATRHQHMCHKSWTAVATSENQLTVRSCGFTPCALFALGRMRMKLYFRVDSAIVCLRCWNANWRRKLLWQAVVTNLITQLYFAWLGAVWSKFPSMFLRITKDSTPSSTICWNAVPFSCVKQICFGNFIITWA